MLINTTDDKFMKYKRKLFLVTVLVSEHSCVSN